MAEKTIGLSKREQQVLKLVARGKSDQEIADELFVVKSTISGHLQNIYDKTGTLNRVALIRWAFANRYLDDDEVFGKVSMTPQPQLA